MHINIDHVALTACAILSSCSAPTLFDESALLLDSVLTTNAYGDIVSRQYFAYNDSGKIVRNVTVQTVIPGQPQDTPLVHTWSYGPYGVSQHDEIMNGAHTVSLYTYDEKGLLTEQNDTWRTNDSTMTSRQIITHYADGRDSTVTIIQPDMTQRATMLYDSQGRDAGMLGHSTEDGTTWTPDSRIEITRDTAGREICSTFHIMLDTLWAQASEERHEYDAMGRETLRVTSGFDDDASHTITTYDAVGNMKTQTTQMVNEETNKMQVEQILEFTYAKNVKQVSSFDKDHNLVFRDTYYYHKK